MSGHWGQPGFWRREGWMLRRVLGLGRFRAPWRLTARELAVHAVFFVANYLVLSAACFAVIDLSARLPQPFGAWVAVVGSIGVWAYIIAAVRGRLPKLTIRRRSTQRAAGRGGRAPCSPLATSRPRSNR